MRRYRVNSLSLFALVIFLNSCVTHRNLTYLQNVNKFDNSIMPVRDFGISVTPSVYKVMPYDILYINVVTPDPQWSVLFNKVPVGTGGALTEQSAALLGYPIDISGDIEVPFIGKLKVLGKTLPEIKFKLDSTLKNYVTDPSITVRMVNNYVSVIGEVNLPGRYPLTKDRINVFEALSMAGDLKDFSDRQKLLLIRQTLNGPVTKEISLSDRSILTSELYYIMPNDILYAPSRKGRGFSMNSSIYSVILSSITTFLVIFSFFRTN
jgi:polysaccharide biosynthesis/export protein